MRNDVTGLGGELPSDWQVVSFGQAVDQRRRFRVGKVKQESYLESGRFPVIDQGQSVVAGYWDDLEDVYDGPLPVIVFGDHTRVFKFAEAPFVCGADGTKILIPNVEWFDPLFLFFAFTHLDIPSRGYNRHFAVLKEQQLPLPPLPEQRAIAHVLRTVRCAKEATEAVLDATRELRRSMMRHLFTYGPVAIQDIDATASVETDIGVFPKSWALIPLADVALKLRAGGTPSRKIPAYWGGEIPFVKIADISESGGCIETTEESINEEGLANSSAWLVPPNAVLLTMYASIGIPAVNLVPVTTNQAIIAIQPDLAQLEPEFLMRQLQLTGSELVKFNVQTTQKNVSKQIVERFPVVVPPKEAQEAIVSMLAAVDRRVKADTDRLSALTSLFDSLLRDLMTARLRVPLELGETDAAGR